MDSIASERGAVPRVVRVALKGAPLPTTVTTEGLVIAGLQEQAEWWLQIAERVSLGFSLTSGALAEIDFYGTVETSQTGTWEYPLSGELEALRLESVGGMISGEILDYCSGDDYYDRRNEIWWAGAPGGQLVRVGRALYVALEEDGVPCRVAVDVRAARGAVTSEGEPVVKGT